MNATSGNALGSLIGYALSYTAGAWLLRYLVKDTPLRPLGSLITLIFAALFFYLWITSASRGAGSDDAGRPTSMRRAICEALTDAWAFAGFGAFLVWFWFVDGRQVGLDAMGQAESWSQALFWGAAAAGLALGVCTGLLRLTEARRSANPKL